jgi:hypothetical protein
MSSLRERVNWLEWKVKRLEEITTFVVNDNEGCGPYPGLINIVKAVNMILNYLGLKIIYNNPALILSKIDPDSKKENKDEELT